MLRSATDMTSAIDRPRVVIGVIGNDTHVVACRILSVGLVEFGFAPVNLGTNNVPSDFADAALETGAAAVLISSLNGEADHWCRGFRKHFEAKSLRNIVLYIGGNLMIGDHDEAFVTARFLEYGFDRVFHRAKSFGVALDTLRADLAHKVGNAA